LRCMRVVALSSILASLGVLAGQRTPAERSQSLAGVPGVTKVSFNRDVRPVLSICFRCHGPDESPRRADMRLDLRDEALKPRRKGIPIVPGKPDESLVVQRIFEANPARVMPPTSIHKELSDAQKETIRRWIEQGAGYEGHWAYQPVERQ